MLFLLSLIARALARLVTSSAVFRALVGGASAGATGKVKSAVTPPW
jgi:hypothetical protein